MWREYGEMEIANEIIFLPGIRQGCTLGREVRELLAAVSQQVTLLRVMKQCKTKCNEENNLGNCLYVGFKDRG